MTNNGSISDFLFKCWARFVTACQSVQAFQERIWIISIQNNDNSQETLLQNTFVISEDSFSSPMSWMHQRGYGQELIKKIDNMQRSQVVEIRIDDQSHRLIRVK